jgi:hypothetical protein
MSSLQTAKIENVEEIYKQNCQGRPMKHYPVECCKGSLQCETCQRIRGEYLEHIACSSESVRQLLTNEQDQQQYLAMKIMAVVWHLPYSCDLTPYNGFHWWNHILYTQLQKVSSSIASKSRRKTHSINLEGTSLKGTTTAMISKRSATNAGWKLFGGQPYTHTNQRYITCP